MKKILVTDHKLIDPIDPSFTQYRESVAVFSKERISPFISEMDTNCKLEESLIKDLFAYNLMNIEIPQKYGGYGGNFINTIIAIEEIAKIDPSVAVFVDVQNSLFNNAIMRWGTEEQKEIYLPVLAREGVGSFSITEKHAGSDTYAMSCLAEKQENGYLLSGEKHWATNAMEAKYFLIFAKMDTEPNSSISAFIVDRQTPGLTILPSQEKMGIRASSTCDIILKDVFVSDENILGGLGMGKRIGLETLTDGRVGIAAQMLGLAEGAYSLALQHAQQRKQFGNFIGAFQGVHFQLAKMAVKIETARQIIYHTIRIKHRNKDFMEYFKLASMTKYHVSQIAEEVASNAVEIFGGSGFMKSSPIEKFYRDAKIGRIYEGTSNIQLRTIAKLIMKIKTKDI